MNNAFKDLENEYNYLIDECTVMNSKCKVILLHFYSSYELILDIVNILENDNENDLSDYVINLVNEINDYCATEFTFYDKLPPKKINREIQDKEYNITRYQKELKTINSNFFKILTEPTEPTKLKRLQDIAIDIVLIRKKLKENKISPDA
jgi:hypothetical protein